MSYNLFLDDIRNPNKFLKDIRTWVVARSYNEFVKIILKEGLPKFISFDHDLPFQQPDVDYYKERTGYDCAKWLIEYCNANGLDIPKYQVHSMNVEGTKNIKSVLESYKRVTKQRTQ